MTRDADGGPVQGAPVEKISHRQATDHDQRSAGLPVALARRYAPSGRRVHPLIVVELCPYCAVAGHAHRDAGTRQAGCTGGAYDVRVGA